MSFVDNYIFDDYDEYVKHYNIFKKDYDDIKDYYEHFIPFCNNMILMCDKLIKLCESDIIKCKIYKDKEYDKMINKFNELICNIKDLQNDYINLSKS